jgi:hypothetical protein
MIFVALVVATGLVAPTAAQAGELAPGSAVRAVKRTVRRTVTVPLHGLKVRCRVARGSRSARCKVFFNVSRGGRRSCRDRNVTARLRGRRVVVAGFIPKCVTPGSNRPAPSPVPTKPIPATTGPDGKPQPAIDNVPTYGVPGYVPPAEPNVVVFADGTEGRFDADCVSGRPDGVGYYPYQGGNIVRITTFRTVSPDINHEAYRFATYSYAQQRWFLEDWKYYDEPGTTAAANQLPQRLPFSGPFLLAAWLAHVNYTDGQWQTSVPIPAAVAQGYSTGGADTRVGVCLL